MPGWAVFKLRFFCWVCVCLLKYLLNPLSSDFLWKRSCKDYFVSANFVKYGGQAEVLSVPRGGKSHSVCLHLAKPENQCPLVCLSSIQTQAMEIPRGEPTGSPSTTTTKEKHHPFVCTLSKSSNSISNELHWCFANKKEQGVLQTGRSILIPAEDHALGHIVIWRRGVRKGLWYCRT